MLIPGFIIIWSELTDIIGRKHAINFTMLVFVAFFWGLWWLADDESIVSLDSL